jgi:hypothetical protein
VLPIQQKAQPSSLHSQFIQPPPGIAWSKRRSAADVASGCPWTDPAGPGGGPLRELPLVALDPALVELPVDLGEPRHSLEGRSRPRPDRGEGAGRSHSPAGEVGAPPAEPSGEPVD